MRGESFFSHNFNNGGSLWIFVSAHDANINAVNTHGQTVLGEEIDTLSKDSIVVRKPDHLGSADLISIYIYEHHIRKLTTIKRIQWMFANGVDVNIGNEENHPLMLSTCKRNVIYGDLVQTFLDNGATSNIKNEDGDTPLMCLLRNYSTTSRSLNFRFHDESIVESFINAQADLNAINTDGQSILKTAQEGKKKAIIFSRKRKYYRSVIKLLKSHGAK